jgi:hypothetical protein
MGCGTSRSTGKVVEVKTKTHNDSGATQTKRGGDDKITSVQKKRTRTVDEIAVTPSQFILGKDESIFKNYELTEKIGEGKELFKV